MKTIILSVRPPWARKLVTGEKTIELRKTSLPGDGWPVRALIYETKARGGCGMLIGEVCLAQADSMPGGRLPRYMSSIQVLRDACITLRQADEYAATAGGRPLIGPYWGRVLYPWMASCATEYPEPRQINGRPPQSWRWARESER